MKKILIISKETIYKTHVENSPDSHVARLVRENDPLTNRLTLSHQAHESTIRQVRQALKAAHMNTTWSCDFWGIVPDDFDMVVTIGGDGTALHASHHIAQTPVLSVNSSPQTSTGHFTACRGDDFAQVFQNILAGTQPLQQLNRMNVMVNGELISSRILNDVLFCNTCPASTSRYQLRLDDTVEQQVSSGIWISTPAGSTAAISNAGGADMPIDAAGFQFAVREPCPSGSGPHYAMPQIIHNIVTAQDSFAIRSKTPQARLYIDGPHVAYDVNYGDVVTFSENGAPFFIYRQLDENKT